MFKKIFKAILSSLICITIAVIALVALSLILSLFKIHLDNTAMGVLAFILGMAISHIHTYAKNYRDLRRELNITKVFVGMTRGDLQAAQMDLEKLKNILDGNAKSINDRLSQLEMLTAGDSYNNIKHDIQLINTKMEKSDTRISELHQIDWVHEKIQEMDGTRYRVNNLEKDVSGVKNTLDNNTDIINSRLRELEINVAIQTNAQLRLHLDELLDDYKNTSEHTLKRIGNIEQEFHFFRDYITDQSLKLEAILKIYTQSGQQADEKDDPTLDLKKLRRMFESLATYVASTNNKIYKLESHCFGMSLAEWKENQEKEQGENNEQRGDN